MRTEVVVFGRVPAPGAVKTRLAAEVGPMVAAQIYCVLLDHTLRVAIHGLPGLPCLPGFPGNLAMLAKQNHESVGQSPRKCCDPSHRDDLLSDGFCTLGEFTL